jgi:hypothetical protein
MVSFSKRTGYTIGVLQKILTAIAAVSLLACFAVCVLWFRGTRGHSDAFGVPGNGVHYDFQSYNANWAVRTVHHDTTAIFDRTDIVPFKTVTGYTLVLPAIWLAILIRKMIPRPTRPPRDLNRLPRP